MHRISVMDGTDGGSKMAASDILYIKADQSAEVQKRDVTLGDILTLECSNKDVLSKVKTLKLLKVPDEGQHRYVFSILKIIECIHEVYPTMDIQNIGSSDIIVTYEKPEKKNPLLHVLKVIGIVIITFIGAAFSIMAFNNDVSTTKLFSQIYELLTGTKSDGFTILELTYSIGLVVGILVFFNHFGGRKFSVDPTPMEVEMRLYENDIQTTLIENYSREKQEIEPGETVHNKALYSNKKGRGKL